MGFALQLVSKTVRAVIELESDWWQAFVSMCHSHRSSTAGELYSYLIGQGRLTLMASGSLTMATLPFEQGYTRGSVCMLGWSTADHSRCMSFAADTK